MKKGDKAAVVCCSNGLPETQQEKIEKLQSVLADMGIICVCSQYLYAEDSVSGGTAKARAEELMNFYKMPDIRVIFDISGGDIANEILPYLDFDLIAKTDTMFWGYSDLTTVVNAIYSQTGKGSVLYQVRNLISVDGEKQKEAFHKTVLEKRRNLLDFSYSFVQQSRMKGIVVGGNTRCLLKLAGTKYWPDMNGKILFLEARSGLKPQMIAFLSQLKQMGVFEQIAGILLGTFTKMEQEYDKSVMIELVKGYAGETLPIACTGELGHGSDSKAVIIGEELELRMSNYEVTKHQMEKEFLKYDQKKMLKKFPLKYDQNYLYIDFLKRSYRIDRNKGKVCWSEDQFLHVTEADFNETMTIFDVLCYSKENCHLAGEFVNMQRLSSIKGGTGPVAGDMYKGEAKNLDHKDSAFSLACEKLGGIKAGKGDVAYEIPVFDFLPFRIQFWDSDDEFDASLQFFMDKNILQFMHYETIWYSVSHLLRRIREEL